VEYVFPDRIHDVFLDTTTGLVTVQLRGLSKNQKWLNNTGKIVQYDVKNQKVLWHKNIAYQTSGLQQFSKTIIYTVANRSYCLDVYSGRELWEVRNNIYVVDPAENIGIGYKFKSMTGYSNELEGIDLKTGIIIWKRNVNREYGWNDVFYINDSTLIVVAAGLHSINIKTGKGWSYNAVSGKKDYTGTATANALGVAAGLLTGTFVISTGHDLVRDIVSNTIVDSTSIYFASMGHIAKIDKLSGEILWRLPFRADMASKSSIFVNDSVLFMINRGFAFMGNRQLNIGKPFLGAFNRQTGKEIFFSLINNNGNPVLGYQIIDRVVFLLLKDKIMKYSIETGTLISEKDFLSENLGELRHYVGKQVFITNQDNRLVSLPQYDSTQMFVYTTQRKILCVDSQLNVTKTFNYEDLNVFNGHIKNIRLIAKGEKTLLINEVGADIAEIDATSKAFIISNVLYDIKDKSLIAIDLSEVISNE
jgi:hypothetical protein